jgi:ABC-type glycerol-3-phosphate transport system substrate-binding protein
MKTKKIVSSFAGLALISGLAACAPAEDTSGAGAEETTAEEICGDLLIWDTGILGRSRLENGDIDPNSFIDIMAQKFMDANPCTTITSEQQGGDISSNAAAFQAAAIAGTGPDMRIQYAGGPTISFGDFFVDVEPYLTEEIMSSMAGFHVNRENYDPSGRLVGMPYGAGNLFTIFQNHAVVEAAGLDPADHPASWEDLLEKAKQVQANTDFEGFAVSNLEGYVGAWFITAMVGGELGQDVFTQMFKGNVPVDHPAMVKAYKAFADWGKSGLTNADAGQRSAGEAYSAFVKGNSAYYLVGSWENNGMLEAFGDKVSSFFIPVLKGAKYPNIGAGGPEIAISIAESSDNKELAGAFLRFLAQPENQDVFVELYQTQASNHVKGDPSKIQNPLLKQQFEHLAKATDGLTFAFDSVMPGPTIDLFYRVNAGVFVGAITPEDAVAQLKASWEQETQG